MLNDIKSYDIPDSRERNQPMKIGRKYNISIKNGECHRSFCHCYHFVRLNFRCHKID